MSRVIVYSTNASDGAVALVTRLRELGLDATKIPINSSKKILIGQKDYLINWGSSKYPDWITRKHIAKFGAFLNFPEYVSNAINKLNTFNILLDEGVSIPEFTVTRHEADWRRIVARSTVTGSGGAGISLVTPEDLRNIRNANLLSSKLFVEYIKKTKEYRVHIFRGSIIDVQEKRKKKNFEGTNYQIRNLANGWVFCRSEVSPPSQVLDQALDAVDALNLDFGAVDIIWNRHYERAYVLEINTAPGLEGSTIDSYAQAILTDYKNIY